MINYFLLNITALLVCGFGFNPFLNAETIVSIQPILAATQTSSSGSALQGQGAALILEQPGKRKIFAYKLWLGFQPSESAQEAINTRSSVKTVDEFSRESLEFGASTKFSFSDHLYLSAGLGFKQLKFSHKSFLSGNIVRDSEISARYYVAGLQSSLETDITFSNNIYVGVEWLGVYTPIYLKLDQISLQSSAKPIESEFENFRYKYENSVYSTNFIVASPRIGYLF